MSEELDYIITEPYQRGYQKGKADILSELLSKDWWNRTQRILMEEWLEQLKEKTE